MSHLRWTLYDWTLWFRPRVIQRRFKRWHDERYPDRKFCMQLGCWDRQFKNWPTCRAHHSCGLKPVPCCGWCPTLTHVPTGHCPATGPAHTEEGARP